MNRLQQLFNKKQPNRKGFSDTNTCAQCGRRVLNTREWFDDFESKGYWVNRVTGEAIFNGEMYSLDPLLIPFDATAQERSKEIATTRGYKCMSCGNVFCAICMLQAHKHPQTLGPACPVCGGIIRTLERVPAAEQDQHAHRRIESRNWADLTASWMLDPEDPRPELWLLCASVSMAESLVQHRPGAIDSFLTMLPDVVEFPDGTGAATFRLRHGENIVDLVDFLLQGEYESQIVTLGGTAKCLPEADESALALRFKPEETIKILLDIIIWRAWGLFAVNS